MDEKLSDCPCKRSKCARHGNCAACKTHHRTEKKRPTACERLEEKKRRKLSKA